MLRSPNEGFVLVTRCSRLALGLAFMLALIFNSHRPAYAHPMQIIPVVVVIRPQATFLTVQFKGNGYDLMTAVGLTSKDRQSDGFSPAAEKTIETYITKNLTLKQGQVLTGHLIGSSYEPDEMDSTKSRFEVTLRYPRDPKASKLKFQVTSNLFTNIPNAPTILSVSGFQKTLNPGEMLSLDPAEVSTNLIRNIEDFALLGMEHIFTGPDHMLFIFGLLLVSTSFWSLAKTLTGFTVAHSITLAISALSIVVLPGRIVDIFIAMSIIYVGVENVYLKSTKHRFLIAGAFGLVHGFGFSTALREIGLPEQGLAWCLLSFNLGVEIAQMIICAIAFPILLRLKKKFDFEAQYEGRTWPQVMHFMSWCVAAMGAYWMLDRIFS